MIGCALDPKLTRKEVGDFKFPLGAYPIETMTPVAGYTLHFEPADSDNNPEEWEAWPDRYVFDIVVSTERLEPLCRLLFSMLPSRIFPIVDFLGHDAFREVDPYMAYELVPLDMFTDGIRRFRDFFFEDGMCGFGAMCEEPFLYMFIDEHKIVTIRVDPGMKDRIERVLKAFGLAEVEESAGSDAASHEHRSVLLVRPEHPDLLGAEEIVERLRERWNLVLNIDPETNIDEEGEPLGVTPWRIIVRVDSNVAPRADAPPLTTEDIKTPSGPKSGGTPQRKPVPEFVQHYAHVLLYADSLRAAEETAQTEIEHLLASSPPPSQTSQAAPSARRATPAAAGDEVEKVPYRAEAAAEQERDLLIVAAIRLDQADFDELAGKKKGRGGAKTAGKVVKTEWLQ